VYTHYYTVRKLSDIYKFFDDSKIIADSLWQHPADFFKMMLGFDTEKYLSEKYYSNMQLWSPRFDYLSNVENHTMIRINTLFRLFSLGYYQVHNVFINILSFTGLIALYKTFVHYASNKRKLLFVFICLPPTVLFWASGVLRESFTLFALGLSVYYLHKLITGSFHLKNMIVLLLAVYLLLMIKIVLCILTLVGFCAWYLSLRIKKLHPALHFIGLALIGFCAVAALSKFTRYDYLGIYTTKQIDFIKFTNGGVYLYNTDKMIYIPYEERNELLKQVSDSLYKICSGASYYYYNIHNSSDTIYVTNSADTLSYKLFSISKPAQTRIEIPLLNSNPMQFIKSAPNAIVNVFIQPSIFKANNIVSFLAALENCFILLLVGFCFIFYTKTAFTKPAWWFCLFMVLSFYCMIGWFTPLPGAMVRYKTVVLPFLMIALVLLADLKKKSDRFLLTKKQV